jgi:NAD(P)-dependent dehydrogenase (short-subunit alcohol dehydrogenase family)
MAEKTALIVGASRGLGLGLAKELYGRGWRVIGTRRSPASDKGLQALADASGGKVSVETLDVRDAAAVDAFAGRMKDRTFDLVFVNAGISGPHKDLADVTAEEVADLFVTNVLAPVRLAQQLADRVREGDGVIAFMTSGLGSVSSDFSFGLILYPASKAALNRLTRDFIHTLGDRKLTVLSMHPGWVRTDMGGPDAPLSIEESCKGMVDVVEAKAGAGEHGFYGHDGKVMPW